MPSLPNAPESPSFNLSSLRKKNCGVQASKPQSECLTSDDLLLIIHLKLTPEVSKLPVQAESYKQSWCKRTTGLKPGLLAVFKGAGAELTSAVPVWSCAVWIPQLVEEALDDICPVGPGVQTELAGGTHAIFIHLPCEDKRMLHQGHHPQAMPLNGEPRPPVSCCFRITIAVTSPHSSSETLSRAVPEPSHQSQDPPFQLQSSSGPLAHGHPGGLSEGASLQTPDVEELRCQDPREARIHLDQARGPGEGGVGQEPQETEDVKMREDREKKQDLQTGSQRK